MTNFRRPVILARSPLLPLIIITLFLFFDSITLALPLTLAVYTDIGNTAMIKSLNRYIYGPTPEERVQEWQRKLRGEQRVLDKEIRQVSASGRADGGYEIFQSKVRVRVK
jgi:hypothetical protein